jgi:hypothetical protein
MDHPNHPGELSIDKAITAKLRQPEELTARARAIEVLQAAEIPFLVGGAYAYFAYTGIYRDTKDLDLFPRKADAIRALAVLEEDGWRTERTDEVWLYKGFKGEYFVDLIFSSGNGIARVDDEWFDNARRAEVMGHQVLIAPPEEMIWSKAFVLERERFDGGDVSHLIQAVGDEMDWARVLRRFEPHWEILLSHLMMYRFAYPSERTKIPDWVMGELCRRTIDSVKQGDWDEKVCRGSLMSKCNYQIDIREWGFRDGREWDLEERQRKDDHEGSELEAACSGSR